MTRSELLNWLHDKYREWQKLLDRIGADRMAEPGVSGAWSVADIVSHMTAWNRWLTERLRAALYGQPEPPPPWPADLKDDDEIHGWIHSNTRGGTPTEILDESHLGFQRFLTVVESLPADVKVARLDPEAYLVWVNDQRFEVSEFFDHFRDDHEADIRSWLARKKR